MVVLKLKWLLWVKWFLVECSYIIISMMVFSNICVLWKLVSMKKVEL